MDREQTIEKAEEAFLDTDVGVYGLSVWSAAELSAADIVRLARSHDNLAENVRYLGVTTK